MNAADILWAIHRVNVAREQFKNIRLNFTHDIQQLILNDLYNEEWALVDMLREFSPKRKK